MLKEGSNNVLPDDILLHSQTSALLDHHQRHFCQVQMGTNRETYGQTTRRGQEILEHSALKGMSPSNLSPWDSVNRTEEKAEGCKNKRGWRVPRNQGFLHTRGLRYHMNSQRPWHNAQGPYRSAPDGVPALREEAETALSLTQKVSPSDSHLHMNIQLPSRESQWGYKSL